MPTPHPNQSSLASCAAYAAEVLSSAESAFIARIKGVQNWAPRGHDTAAIEAEIEKLTHNIDAGWDLTREMADIAARQKSEAARRRLRSVEEELAGYESRLRDLQARRDRMASTAVLRRLSAIQQAFKQEPLVVAEANKALKQAVSKIVWDTEDATMTVYWHHVDQPSDPINFYSRHTTRWDDPQPTRTTEAQGSVQQDSGEAEA